MKAQLLKKILTWCALFSLIAGVFATSPAVFAKKKMKKIVVSSTAFKNGGDIANKYAYNGFDIPGAENISIPLNWKTMTKKVVSKTKSFAVTIVDLHPIAEKFVHLFAYNIPAGERSLEEGALSGDMAKAPLGTLVGRTTDGNAGYVGPYPPPNEGNHVYDITVYALNVEKLEIAALAQISEAGLKKLLKGKIVAKGKLKGNFGYTTTAMGDSMGDSAAMPKTVEITAAGFSPNSVTINAGEKVEFVNKDTQTHWPASDTHPTHTAYPQSGGCISSAFDACAALEKDGTWGFVFTEKGTWRYHDHLNPSFKGTVVVE